MTQVYKKSFENLTGKTVVIKGRVMRGADRFHINFQYDDEKSGARPDIALQFKCCYLWICDIVVCNTFHGGLWGSEQWTWPCPIKRGNDFTLKIRIGSDYFEVSTENDRLLEYKHRISPRKVSTVVVGGGAEIDDVRILNGSNRDTMQN